MRITAGNDECMKITKNLVKQYIVFLIASSLLKDLGINSIKTK